MEKEIEKFIQLFEGKYGHTPERTKFFMAELPRFAERVFKVDVDLDKELRNFIDEYKKKGLGGFNATYGNLYHWLIDFAAMFLKVDAFELRSRALCI
ncbi:MAG: hypothetical protein UR93_C0020G0001, partial [Berkelbacteria bacterium GW2011_GWA2_35_9]